jgi:hypothetical protein
VPIARLAAAHAALDDRKAGKEPATAAAVVEQLRVEELVPAG